MKGPERLGNIISVRGVPGKGRRRVKLEALKTGWARVAGEEVARHSSPARFEKGVLHVSADGPSWASELSMRSAEIKRKANSILGQGEVKRVRVSPRGRYRRPEGPENAAGEAAGEERLEPGEREAVGRIEDGGLRDSLSRMMRASKGNKRNKPYR